MLRPIEAIGSTVSDKRLRMFNIRVEPAIAHYRGIANSAKYVGTIETAHEIVRSFQR